MVGNEWRELGEHFPGQGDTSVSGGLSERLLARGAVRGVVLALRKVAMAAAADDYDAASQTYADYKAQVMAAVPILNAAEPWSLFNSQIREAHFGALQSLARLAR